MGYRQFRPALAILTTLNVLTLRHDMLDILDTPHVYMYTVHMGDLRFEWDEAKNRTNRRKHGISFEEAQTAFLDENAMRYFDPEHSGDEDRFLLLGMSWRIRVLVVCHCFRVDDSIVRIISARRADKKESNEYWS